MDQPHLLRLIPGLFGCNLLFRLGLSEGREEYTNIVLQCRETRTAGMERQGRGYGQVGTLVGDTGHRGGGERSGREGRKPGVWRTHSEIGIYTNFEGPGTQEHCGQENWSQESKSPGSTSSCSISSLGDCEICTLTPALSSGPQSWVLSPRLEEPFSAS